MASAGNAPPKVAAQWYSETSKKSVLMQKNSQKPLTIPELIEYERQHVYTANYTPNPHQGVFKPKLTHSPSKNALTNPEIISETAIEFHI